MYKGFAIPAGIQEDCPFIERKRSRLSNVHSVVLVW